MSTLNGIISPSGGSAPDLTPYVLLAGDADGQVIQGRTGANAARVDIGETDQYQAALVGGGETHGIIFAYDVGIYGESPDGNTSFDLYNAGVAIDTDGDASFTGGTSTNLGGTLGWTAVGGSRVNIISLQTPPTNANDSGTAGDFILTSTAIYVCVADNSWKKADLAAW